MCVIKKSELIDIIQSLKPFSSPKLEYEQYVTDAIATADLMFHIAFEQQDLHGNLLVDMGCGPGNLSIAAVLLGAEHVIAVDIDKDAIKNLNENIQNLQFDKKITPINADIKEDGFIAEIKKTREKMPLDAKIVVFTNPPFGVHNRGLDLLFLKQAVRFADIIYSIHNASPKSEEFLKRKIEEMGGVIVAKAKLDMILKHTYEFHQKQQKRITTDVYKIIVKKDE